VRPATDRRPFLFLGNGGLQGIRHEQSHAKKLISLHEGNAAAIGSAVLDL
jgi:hypothetical protein